MIKLDKNLLLAKGSERFCYIHPADKDKLIKIIYKNKTKNDQNKLEFKYYRLLNEKNISYSNIPKCYGWIKTNMGNGLVFERIIDSNGENSKQLTFYLKNKILNDDMLTKLLNDLYNYLISNNVLFLDVATLNVLCQKKSKTQYKLVIVDGLGPKKDDYKFFLYKYFPLYKKYKILKQWKKFIKLVNKLK